MDSNRRQVTALIIAVVIDENTTLGYRLLQIPSNNNYDASHKFHVLDIKEEQLKQAILSNRIKILNADVRDNKLVGTNGALARYTKISSLGVNAGNKSPLTILKKIATESDDRAIGYIASDYHGKVINGQLNDIINYIKLNGVSNGKLVTKDNNEYISPIEGNYDCFKIKQTIKDADKDKITPISIQDFERRMQIRGETYKLEYSRLEWVTTNLTTLVIPDGITSFGDLSLNSNTTIKRLYIPKSVIALSRYAFKNLEALEEIILDDDNKSLDFYVINLMLESMAERKDGGRGVKISIPKENIRRITRYHNASNTDTNIVSLSEFKQGIELGMGFCNTDIDDIDISTVTKLNGSIMYTELRSGKLKIGKQVTDIYRSVVATTINEIDFSEAVNLGTIKEGSFSDVIKIAKLDLSNCGKLIEINNSFRNLEYMQEAILPESLQNILCDSFSGCKQLSKINMPENLRNIGSQFIGTQIEKLVFSDKIEGILIKNTKISIQIKGNMVKAHSNMLSGSILNEVELPDTLKNISKKFAQSAMISKMNMPLDLEAVEEEAFLESGGLSVFDFSKCKNLKIIEDSAFENSSVEIVILNDGIEELGSKVFRYAERLRKIYVPNTVNSIGTRWLEGAGKKIPMGCTVYTQKGSKVDLYCNRNHITVKYVDSAEEAVQVIILDTQITKGKKSKLNLILSGSEMHSVLLEDKYIDNAEEYLRLYSLATNEEEQIEVKLDERNLISIGSERFISKEDIANSYRNTVAARVGTVSALNDSIINIYINYISNVIGWIPNIQREKSILEIAKGIDKDTLRVEIDYNHKIIMTGKVDLLGITYTILMVIVDNKVRYYTVYKADSVRTVAELEFNSCDKVTGALDERLKKNTTYAFREHAGRVVPRYIDIEINKALNRQFILVGSTKINKGKVNAYFLSLATGKIVQTIAQVSNRRDIYMSNLDIEVIVIKNVYTLDELGEKDREIIEASGYEQEFVSEIINKIAFSDDDLNELMTKPDAFNKAESCMEWELSNAMHECGISKIEDFNMDVVNLFFDTAFFTRVRRGIKTLSKFEIVKEIPIKGGDYFIRTYGVVDNDVKISENKLYSQINYLTIVVNNDDKVSSAVGCVAHSLPLSDIMKELNEIHSENDIKPKYTIDNLPDEEDDYKILGNWHHIYGDTGKIKSGFGIGINKASGVVFVIGRVRDLEYGIIEEPGRIYKIFAYKDLREAVKYFTWLKGSVSKFGDTYYSLDMRMNMAKNLIKLLEAGRRRLSGTEKTLEASKLEEEIKQSCEITNNTELIDVRKLVLAGYPNGYALTGFKKYVFDPVLKQRNRQ